MKTATRKYRFVSTTLSKDMVPALERHLPKIGCPLEVKAVSAGQRSGWYQLVVTGMLGTLVLKGCSWGYGGSGPHATRDVLVKLGIPKWDADRLAFETDGRDVGTPAAKGKVYFTRALLPQVPSGTTYIINDGRVVILNSEVAP